MASPSLVMELDGAVTQGFVCVACIEGSSLFAQVRKIGDPGEAKNLSLLERELTVQIALRLSAA